MNDLKIKLFLTSIFLIGLISQTGFSQVIVTNQASPTNAKINRQRGLNMLDEIKDIIKQHYYDKNYKGIDLDERFKLAKEKVKTLDQNWQIFRVIAQVLLDFKDSHTMFYPPGRANRPQYGFTIQMIGSRCFVTNVKKNSDAEKKGLKPGDWLVGIGQYAPTRDNLWVINYLLYALDPQEQLKLAIKQTDGSEKELTVETSFKSIEQRQKEAFERRKKKKEAPYKCHEINTELITCRLETFSVDKKHIDAMMKEVGNHSKLILDLRGNGGGYVKIEEYLTGYLFDREVKIGDFISRKKTKEVISKPHKNKVFKGDLIVLIDSNSASASEVFARVVQLEKRGKVVGDVSAGAVMTSISLDMANVRGAEGFETFSVFGMSVTIADLIMSDGNRLENVGVIPDYPVGPTSYALLNRTDPVMVYSAKLFGVELSEKTAAEFKFLIPKDEDEDDKEETDDEENRVL